MCELLSNLMLLCCWTAQYIYMVGSDYEYVFEHAVSNYGSTASR